MSETRWRWLSDAELAWGVRSVDTPTPALQTDGGPPIIGRILGPHGQTIAVVRPPAADPLPFGFA